MRLSLLCAILSIASMASVASAGEPFVRIRAVGDMMIGNAPTNEVPQHFFFAKVAGALRDADITFGNHEGTLCDSGIRGRKCPEVMKRGELCYAFRSPTHLISQFKEAGFDVLHLANNHIFDYYEDCANDTKKTVENAGILSVGLLDEPRTSTTNNTVAKLLGASQVVQFGGKRIAFLGFHYSNVYNRVISIREIETAKKLIQALKASNDIVVATMHAGAEGKDKASTPNTDEMHRGENRGNMQAFSKAVIDAGADLVIGHGPHVLRGMEIYKKKLIIYSLGNFATYTHFSFDNPMQIGAIVEAGLDENGNFVAGEIISTHQYWLKNAKGSRLHVELDFDAKKRGEQEIVNWSLLDFPKSAPKFDNKGKFYPQSLVLP